MTVSGHWTLCGLCPDSRRLLYEICSLFVRRETLFALKYSVWGRAVSNRRACTLLRSLWTLLRSLLTASSFMLPFNKNKVIMPARVVSFSRVLEYQMNLQVHTTLVKPAWRSSVVWTQTCSSSLHSDVGIDVMDLQLWMEASPDAWPSLTLCYCLRVSLDTEAGHFCWRLRFATCVKTFIVIDLSSVKWIANVQKHKCSGLEEFSWNLLEYKAKMF